MTLPAKLHAATGAAAMLAILTLQVMLAFGEASGYAAEIAALRGRILWIVCLALIPALVMTGASGAALGRRWRSPLVAAKMMRMRVVAAIGLLVLLPLAIALWYLAGHGMIDGRFYLMQRVEALAGLINLLLLGLNLRDGLRLRRPRTASSAA